MPRRVNDDGSFTTFWLQHFYNRIEVSERRRRSIDSDVEKLYLMLAFNGADHHVELTPYHDFISPDMVIETRGDGPVNDLNARLRIKRVSDDQCHYRGFVRGHSNSRAALSLCDGVVCIICLICNTYIKLNYRKGKKKNTEIHITSFTKAGYIQTDHGRYFIEPISDSKPGKDGQHVHMIYNRQAPHDQDSPRRLCGTAG